jgi:hypothetical protein
MVSLVDRLQRDATDPNISVTSLLRQVKVIAAKLDLGAVERWVNDELNGYAHEEVPAYRQISGAPRVHNHVKGSWMPILGDDKLVEKLSVRAVGQKTSELEHLLTDTQRHTFQIPFPPWLIDQLNSHMEYQFGEMALLVSSAAIVGILDAVRDRVLTWALELERLDIKGDNFSFTDTEKDRAQRPNVTMNIGSIGSFTGNLGVGNTARDINSSIDLEEVRLLLKQIGSHAGALQAEGVDGRQLQECLAKIGRELEKKNTPILRKSLEELQTIVVRTAGGLISSGIGALLHKILGTGVPL